MSGHRWSWIIIGTTAALVIAVLWASADGSAGCPPDWRQTPCSGEGRQIIQRIAAGQELALTLTPAQAQALVRCLVGDPRHTVLAGMAVDIAPGELDIALRFQHLLAWPICVRMRWLLREAGAGHFQWQCREWRIGRLAMPAFLRSALSSRVNQRWDAWVSRGWEVQRLELSRGLVRCFGRRR
ncbi:MAG: hypothetical protein ACUVT1_08280 [Anaerolineae bacterium]